MWTMWVEFLRMHWRRLRIWLMRQSLPGFEGVSLYEVLSFVYQETGKDDITTRANSAAYSFFISIFPSTLFFLTMVPYSPMGQELLTTFQSTLARVMPGDVGGFISSLISDLKTLRGGLLSFGFIAAIYFASNGMDALMRGFEKHDVEGFRDRTWLERRAVAMVMTLVLFLLLIFSVVVVIVGHQLFEYFMQRLDYGWFWQVFLTFVRYLLVLIVLYVGISFIYRFGPSLRHRSKFLSPGAMLATLACIISTVAFSFFIDNYGQYNQLYGAIGAVIVAMLYLQIICFVILIGFELNASIAVGTYRKLGEDER